MPEGKALPRAKQLLAELGLEDVLQKRCEDLSTGMLQRVQFVGSMLHQPELLILDEPFSGLDPVSVRALKGVIAAERRRGTTILFSTHVMAQAEELCDRVVMIHKGRKVLDESMNSLRRRYDPTRVLFEPLEAQASLDALRGAARVVPARIEIARITLEDVFVGIVRGQADADESEAALRQHLQGLSGEKA